VASAAFLIPWKLSTQHGDPELAVLCLLLFAALFATFASLFDRANLALLRGGLRPTLRLALLMSFFTLAGNWASAESVQRISGALLAVLQRFELIVVALLGAVVLRERVRPTFWVGAAVAMGGLVLLNQRDLMGIKGAEVGGGADGLDAQFDPLGVLYGLGSALFFGSMFVLQRRLLAGVHLVPLNALRLWLGVLLWFAVYQRVPTADQLNADLLHTTAAAAFFGPFLSRMGTLVSARHVPAAVTVFVVLSTPIFALALAWAWLGDLPQRHELLGGAVMLVGISIPALAMLRRTA
jgi:drug/metabolite transporter (DMT)-like permease